WFMRRMGSMGGMTAGNLKVLGGISVGQRERIVLVQAGDTQLLVGVAPGEIRTLHVMEEPIVNQVTSNQTNTKVSTGFAEKLHAAIKNRGKA
ncbi:MAG: flagellar biosynthetic protein FliO, partial [Gammaproteobacteria bacterium]|nr:flagellar biosynthetic protein FliO [Gammaproteobacteria bacterium]